MKYLTTLEVAHQLRVSKQTLLNWLYAGKVPEPPRNPKGYRLWSEARVDLVRRMIADGRLNKRTVLHHEPSNAPDVLERFAREVRQFLADAGIETATFLRALRRAKPIRAKAKSKPKPGRAADRSKPKSKRAVGRARAHSQGMSGINSRSTGRPSRK
jgi:DNA-binding transcriptional MerR regulator